MNADQETREFATMPEQHYQELVRKARQIAVDTALSVDEHRKIVYAERAGRKVS